MKTAFPGGGSLRTHRVSYSFPPKETSIFNIKEDNIMDKQFLSAHYDHFCCTNIELISGDIRGIILYFNGLGHIVNPGADMIDAPAAAARNILYITPCYNPWS